MPFLPLRLPRPGRPLLLAALLLAAPLLAAHPALAVTDDTARAEAVMGTHVRALHDRLHITAAEEPQWDAMAAAMMENARHMAALHQQQGDAPLTAPMQLRLHAAIAQAHAEDTQRMLAPFDTLYGVMSPQQREVADRTFREVEAERARKAGL